MVGFIKKITEHGYTQNIQSLRLKVSEKKTFMCFSHCKYMGANDAPGGAIFDPRGMIGRVYVEHHTFFHVSPIISLWQIFTPPGHETMPYTKYKISELCDFREEDLFMFFPIISL